MVLYETAESGREKIIILHDMSEGSKTAIKCTVGLAAGFESGCTKDEFLV